MEAKCQDLEETVHDLKDQLKVKANSTLNETTNSDVAALAAEIEILQSEKVKVFHLHEACIDNQYQRW